MNHSLYSIKKLYDIDRKTAASIMAMLSNLEVGEEFSSNLGNIRKVSESDFKLSLSKSHVNNIISELLNDGNIQSIFS
jgi:hypothetical protein